jgi:DNA polymerase
MSIITIDFETYYDKDYSLSKMTTEEYINDPRFEVIGMGIKVDDDPSEWYTDPDIEYVLRDMDWSEHAIVCHNTLFDGAILAWKYGVKPGMWFDTLSMARAKHGINAGGSLAALVTRYGLGEKGTEVINALGKSRADFTAQELYRYGEYCKNDADLTYKLFNALMPFPDDELRLIDMTLRMYTEPQFGVVPDVLQDRLQGIREDKSALLASLVDTLGVTTEEEVRKELCSNPKFAQVLHTWGVPIPMKTSPTTNKETFAFAKTDEGFIALQEHPDPVVQTLCAVRLGTKSTMEESRIERFIGIGERNNGALPVPLKYYGAHTGRWAGLDSINFQNLPSRDKKKKALKNAIVPLLRDHVVVNADSSQIEARMLAYVAGQDDVVSQFARGEDVYSVFAEKIYNRPVSRNTPIERFVGKTCILGLGFGTGAIKLQHTLKTQPPGAELILDECKRIVSVYRSSNYKIVEFWERCEQALRDIMAGNTGYWLDANQIIWVGEGGLRLPNGLWIYYPNLRIHEGKTVYDSRRGIEYAWGGSVTENVIQALARITVGGQLIKIAEIVRPALTVHDSAVLVVHKDKLQEILDYVTLCMSTAPDWAPGLPVSCEVKYGESYGECG